MVARFAIATLLAFAAVLTVAADGGGQRQPPRPLPHGDRIVVRDGDTIVLERDTRVRIVRRREAMVRAVFNTAERWLVLLADFAGPTGAPDGRVDMAYHFTGITGEWPMDERWQGLTVVEESSIAPDRGSSSLALTGPRGLVQLVDPLHQDDAKDSTAIAVLSYGGSGSGTTDGISFDEAEQRRVAEVRRDRSRSASGQAGTGSLTASWSLSGGVAVDTRTASDAPLRVGGRVRTPVKIVDVPPVVPDAAIRAGVKGLVIVEITIETDGSVKNARVLRSIPLLDQAALDAVRQWRYEPPTLDGQPVTVVMTVTVPFS